MAWTKLKNGNFGCPVNARPMAQNIWTPALLGWWRQGWTLPTVGRSWATWEWMRHGAPGTVLCVCHTSINPTITPHPPRHGFPKCFSHNSMQEPYFHQQHQLTCPVISPRPGPHLSNRDTYCPYAHCSLYYQINSIYLVHSIFCIKTNLTYEEMLILNLTFPKSHVCST